MLPVSTGNSLLRIDEGDGVVMTCVGDRYGAQRVRKPAACADAPVFEIHVTTEDLTTLRTPGCEASATTSTRSRHWQPCVDNAAIPKWKSPNVACNAWAS